MPLKAVATNKIYCETLDKKLNAGPPLIKTGNSRQLV